MSIVVVSWPTILQPQAIDMTSMTDLNELLEQAISLTRGVMHSLKGYNWPNSTIHLIYKIIK